MATVTITIKDLPDNKMDMAIESDPPFPTKKSKQEPTYAQAIAAGLYDAIVSDLTKEPTYAQAIAAGLYDAIVSDLTKVADKISVTKAKPKRMPS